MLAVTRLIARGRGLSRVLRARAASVTLDWDARCRSRFAARDSLGRELGVFLPRGSVVRGGDVLVAEDGSLVRVEAAAQPVLVVRAGAGGALDLARAAYHLGNRHVALEVQADRLQLEPDHVLAEMLERMHLLVSEELAPFEPEGGAYGAAAAHAPAGHAHGGHDHDHDHGHDHGHGHDDGHDHGHGHGD